MKLKDLYSLGYAPDASARELLKLGLGSVNVVTKDGSKSSNFRVLGRGEHGHRKSESPDETPWMPVLARGFGPQTNC